MKIKSNLFAIFLFIIIILIFLFLISKREYSSVRVPKTIAPIIRTIQAPPTIQAPVTPNYVEIEIVGPFLFGPDAINYTGCLPWTDSAGAGIWIYPFENYPNTLYKQVSGNEVVSTSVYKESNYMGLVRSKDLHGTNDYAQRITLYVKRNVTFGFKAKPGREFSYAWQTFTYTPDNRAVKLKILTGNRYNKGKIKPFFVYEVYNNDSVSPCTSY